MTQGSFSMRKNKPPRSIPPWIALLSLLPLTLTANPALASAQAHSVDPAITWLFTGILLAMVGCLAFEEKLHAKKSLITGLFALLSLLLATALDLLPFGPVINVFNESLHLPVYIPGIDWEVIAIIVGASLFVDVTSKSGLFSYLAIRLTKASKGDPRKLLIYYGCMTVLFSALLNNVTAMIIIGSLTGVSLAKLNQSKLLLGFLLTEGLLTNIGGLLTLISSVPNIILGNIAGITFLDFFLFAAPFVLISTWATLLLAARVFRIESLTDPEDLSRAEALVAGFDESEGIPSPAFFKVSIVLFALLVLTFSLQSVLPLLKELGMGFVALLFAFIALIRFRHDVDEFYRGIDWDLIFFFMTLFMVINVMEHAQVLALIGTGMVYLLDLGATASSLALLWSSAIASSVTDNIPLAAMLGKILAGMGLPTDSLLWWSVIFGANLGGNITPIGSASTVVAVTLMHKANIKLSFSGFVTKAFIFAVLQLLLASLYLFVIAWI
jgi:Na+/H+ antiporter NhaD/arsenite permease-like protein|tara:strand:+ start:949 stop:2439 length:1491 start_codon:yes stop_codon:yes gene_type:complete